MWFFLLLPLIFTLGNCKHWKCKGYYWRDYTGKIPEDAVLGARDKLNNKTLYIGQTYLQNHGLITVQINEGEKFVTSLYNGKTFKSNSNSNVKILCGDAKTFKWVSTTGKSINTTLLHYTPLKGGIQNDLPEVSPAIDYNMYIGRAYYKGVAHIGKVDPWLTTNVPLYVEHNKKLTHILSYQLLVYNDEYLCQCKCNCK